MKVMMTVVLSERNQEVETLGVAITSKNTTLLKQAVDQIGEKSEGEIQAIWQQIESDLEADEIAWFHEQLSEVAPGIVEPLTQEEKTTKQEIETRLHKFFCSFFERGKDLLLLRTAKLYREDYPSWTTYCRMQLGIQQSQADRLIKAYQVVEELKPFGFAIMPSTEAVARELGKVKNIDDRVVVWQTALQVQTDKPITSETIKRIRIESEPPKEAKQLPLQVGELVVVDCKDSHLHDCWGRIFNITNSGRYKVKVGLELVVLKTDEVIVPQEIDDDFCERVESIISTRFDSQLREIAATFYKTQQPQYWQLKLLTCLEEICQ